MAARFHLGWFMNFSADEWNTPFASGGSPWSGRFYIEMAQALERACFDYIMIEDTLMLSDAYGGNSEVYLKHAVMAPKHDPAPLAAIIAAATTRLGVVATMSTTFYPPFLLARLAATIDGIAEGRFGWNIVTSAEDHAARNFGLDKIPDHDVRYDVAEEYMEVVNKLFAAWEPDAIMIDRASGTYADASKVHPINHEGEFFKVRGPLNTAPSPQGRPVYVQAGGSPRGRDFAAEHADSIIAVANGVEGMREFREDVRLRAKGFGRDPDDIKVLFVISPILAEVESEARAKQRRILEHPSFIEQRLATMASITDINFAEFDLDAPLPPGLTTNGERTSLEKFMQKGRGGEAKTLRQLVVDAGSGSSSIEMVGTPDQVAARMGEVMEEVGGDGFLISAPGFKVGRRYLSEITDGLVPALQRLGLTRTVYTQSHLRDTLLEF
ncbi:MAG: FMN-dependent oxidoreductase, nitrilotriacetate monooxygenase family [Jatrophihabitantaceae bacterium]|nr:FMN-dependent oxidoreductase, nitrilotriacetate monooxygenase family [Jatrophihabitantaceae bacterium]